MCLGIFIPTYRRLALFLFFSLLPLTGILSLLPPLQVFLSLPFALWKASAAIIVQIIYSYVLACVYASAYTWLERSLRSQFPHMNDIVEKRRKKRSANVARKARKSHK